MFGALLNRRFHTHPECGRRNLHHAAAQDRRHLIPADPIRHRREHQRVIRNRAIHQAGHRRIPLFPQLIQQAREIQKFLAGQCLEPVLLGKAFRRRSKMIEQGGVEPGFFANPRNHAGQKRQRLITKVETGTDAQMIKEFFLPVAVSIGRGKAGPVLKNHRALGGGGAPQRGNSIVHHQQFFRRNLQCCSQRLPLHRNLVLKIDPVQPHAGLSNGTGFHSGLFAQLGFQIAQHLQRFRMRFPDNGRAGTPALGQNPPVRIHQNPFGFGAPSIDTQNKRHR